MLKAHNAGDSDPAEQFAEAQSALLAALQDSSFPVPRPLPLRPPADDSTDGFVLRVAAADSRVHAVRMLSWLPGTLLVDAPQVTVAPVVGWVDGCGIGQASSPPIRSLLNSTPSTPICKQSLEVYRQLGGLLGRMNAWLQERRWDWSRTGALRRPAFDWNVQTLPATYARVRPSLLALSGLDV